MHIQKWFALHNFFDEKNLAEITKLTDDVALTKARVISKNGKSLRNFLQRNCLSGWIHRDAKSDWLFKEITNCVNEVNNRTLKFDLQDARKYSVSIQLSDENDYVGGNLTIRGEGQSRYAPRGRGSIAVFPSHLLHQAKPVWIGKRKVIVAWIRGKKPLS